MAYKVLISDEALGDLDAITGFIKEHGSPDAARKWLQGVLQTIGSLSVMPERCMLAPEAVDVGAPVRLVFHGRRNRAFQIFFLVAESKAEHSVRVLHVRHWARGPLAAEQLVSWLAELRP